MKKYSIVILILLIQFGLYPQDKVSMEYTLSMNEPHTHYFEVEIKVKNYEKDAIEFLMPVWAPGSYLVREFAKNVSFFEASDTKDNPLLFEKTNKYTWKVYLNNTRSVKIKYKVYAFEMSVRTSFLNASHGYLNGTSVFMYVEDLKNKPSVLKVIPYKDWKEVSTGLTIVNGKKWEYYLPNYDILADSPIEIGNQKIYQFTAAGIPHKISMYGEGNYNIDSLKVQMAQVVEIATNIFGENPNKKYMFIIHNLGNRGGGLEHLNSTTLQFKRWGYDTKNRSKSFLSLVAHEYFHLWNVKRIRPLQLGPFDYQKENYTKLLWEMEGVTSYYSGQILLRAGFYTQSDFLNRMEGSINSLVNRPGNEVQSAALSSYDSWIKYYRSNENSYNTEISYYTKGSVLGMLLDLVIINSTNGKKNYDDVLRYLYNNYYKKLKRGFTEEEMKETLELIAGKNLDSFFADYVNGTKKIDYNKFLGYAGLKIEDLNKNSKKKNLGIRTRTDNGKLLIRSVVFGTPAYDAGLNVKDEIIAVNNYRVDNKLLDNFIKENPLGKELNFLISRDGVLKNIKIMLRNNPKKKYVITEVFNPTDKQIMVYNKWMRVD